MTCGRGLAQHSAVPAKIALMFQGLAETLELHRAMLVLDDPNSRAEDDIYRDLAASWKDIAERVRKTAAIMAAQHDLPMGAHDAGAWGELHLRAFEKFVNGQTEVLALLRVAAEHDEAMLASMTKQA
jgi:hypothetical protein